MAKLGKGILGGISGKVGNVVGGNWKGIDYIRSKPSSVKNPNTEAQQKQRQQFKIVSQFLSQIQPLVVMGYTKPTKNVSAMNVAMAYHLREAIAGEFPDYVLDTSRIQFSDGKLANAHGVVLDVSVIDTVSVGWQNDGAALNASLNDVAMLLVYNTNKGIATYKANGSLRDNQAIELTIPAEWKGDDVAIYLAFRSETGKLSSNTLFVGQVVIPV